MLYIVVILLLLYVTNFTATQIIVIGGILILFDVLNKHITASYKGDFETKYNPVQREQIKAITFGV